MLRSTSALLEQEPDIERLRAIHILSKTDPRSAIEDYKILVEQGSVLAMLYLGYLNKSGGDPQDARRWFRAAYEHGASDGALNLGFMEAKIALWSAAEPWFAIAADNGDEIGMYYLAVALIAQGRFGSEPDEIVRLLEEASKRGSIRAASRLGHIYMRGQMGLGRIPSGVRLFLSSLRSAAREAWQNPQSRRLW